MTFNDHLLYFVKGSIRLMVYHMGIDLANLDIVIDEKTYDMAISGIPDQERLNLESEWGKLLKCCVKYHENMTSKGEKNGQTTR